MTESKVCITKKPNSPNNQIIYRCLDVKLGSSTYQLKASATRNSNVVLKWYKKFVISAQSSIPISVMHVNGDFVVGFFRRNKIRLYQLKREQEIPKSLLDFFNDEIHLRFHCFGSSAASIESLKALGFDLKVSNAEPSSVGIFLKKQFTDLGNQIFITAHVHEHDSEAIMQEGAIEISSLYLLRALLGT